MDFFGFLKYVFDKFCILVCKCENVLRMLRINDYFLVFNFLEYMVNEEKG